MSFRIHPCLFLAGLVCSLTNCIPNVAYRTMLPPCDGLTQPACSVQIVKSTRDVPIAFIEFDDMGQAFKRGQMAAAEKMIQDQKPEDGDVLTILFIHGWKNNASDDSGNVPGFRRFLQDFQAQLGSTKVVGVYFGWRGGTTNAAVIKELTYWNRRDTGTYIPGSNMSEALFRVARAAKGSDYKLPSKLIVVGHSFGGLVLERTVTQHLTRRVIENPGVEIQPFADLLVFVNEAAAATEAVQLLTMLRERIEPQEVNYPTILSITSQGDLATRFVLPVGQGASLFKKDLRDYGGSYDPDPFGITKQKTYYLRSAAHIPELQSHVVGNRADIVAAYKTRGYTCANIAPRGAKPDRYYVVPILNAKNDTRYWLMEMPVEIVPDHSNIFRVEFGALLQAFLLRQSQEDGKTSPTWDNCYETTGAPEVNMRRMRSTFKVNSAK